MNTDEILLMEIEEIIKEYQFKNPYVSKYSLTMRLEIIENLIKTQEKIKEFFK